MKSCSEWDYMKDRIEKVLTGHCVRDLDEAMCAMDRKIDDLIRAASNNKFEPTRE